MQVRISECLPRFKGAPFPSGNGYHVTSVSIQQNCQIHHGYIWLPGQWFSDINAVKVRQLLSTKVRRFGSELFQPSSQLWRRQKGLGLAQLPLLGARSPGTSQSPVTATGGTGSCCPADLMTGILPSRSSKGHGPLLSAPRIPSRATAFWERDLAGSFEVVAGSSSADGAPIWRAPLESRVEGESHGDMGGSADFGQPFAALYPNSSWTRVAAHMGPSTCG